MTQLSFFSGCQVLKRQASGSLVEEVRTFPDEMSGFYISPLTDLHSQLRLTRYLPWGTHRQDQTKRWRYNVCCTEENDTIPVSLNCLGANIALTEIDWIKCAPVQMESLEKLGP
jgi:hypothetical protein